MPRDYSEETDHARERGRERSFSPEDVERAIESAGTSGATTTQMGKYGAAQLVYVGTNGLTVVLETGGRNAGKLITAWWRNRE